MLTIPCLDCSRSDGPTKTPNHGPRNRQTFVVRSNIRTVIVHVVQCTRTLNTASVNLVHMLTLQNTSKESGLHAGLQKSLAQQVVTGTTQGCEPNRVHTYFTGK